MAPQSPVGHHRGSLVEWNDERGFGFISPDGGGHRVFVHVSAFPRGSRPATGRKVTYAAGLDERNRPRASAVRYVGPAGSRRGGVGGTARAGIVAGIFFAVLAVLVVLNEVPLIVAAVYALVSAVTFAAYRFDKSAARAGRRRTPESTLHTLALFGGWPGALVAQQVWRHKTTKQPFRTFFWGTVILNCAALTWLVTHGFPTLA